MVMGEIGHSSMEGHFSRTLVLCDFHRKDTVLVSALRVELVRI